LHENDILKLKETRWLQEERCLLWRFLERKTVTLCRFIMPLLTMALLGNYLDCKQQYVMDKVHLNTKRT
jgi:hypothetical protein